MKLETAIALVKLTIFTLLVPATVTVWVPFFFFSRAFRLGPPELGIPGIAGAAMIALGVAGYLWCSLEFAFTGRGTPAPLDPPKHLVAKGLFRYVRNPMYISVFLVLAGECVLFQSWTLLKYAAVFVVGVNLFVLFYEEPALRRKFGHEYEEYCRRVPRWIPRRRG